MWKCGKLDLGFLVLGFFREKTTDQGRRYFGWHSWSLALEIWIFSALNNCI
jgi:hypothetical protein